MTDKQKRIKAIEESQTMGEAATKTHLSRQYLYWWLKDNGLKVVRDTSLKVVEIESDRLETIKEQV